MGILEDTEKRINKKIMDTDSLNLELAILTEELNKVILEKEKYSQMASSLQMEIQELKVRRKNMMRLSSSHKELKTIFQE